MRLREFLENNKIKGEVFAENTKITHRTLMNALSGKDVSLSTAKKIVKSTHGAVTIDDLGLDESDDHADHERKKQQQQNNAGSDTPIRLENS